MTLRIWPVDSIASVPSFTGRWLRQTMSAFLAGATSARPLGALSGVRPGTPTTTVAATSTTWTVTPFAGVIDGQAAAIAGPYAFSVDANVTGGVTAADATNPRVDIVYVRVSDPAEGDGSAAPIIEVLYLAGTPAGSPVAPATPARSFVIANINVPVSGGGSPTVTWNAPYVVAAGAPVPFNTQAQLLAWTPATARQQATVIADSASYKNGTYRWSGSAWVGLAVDRVTTTVLAGTTYDGISPLIKIHASVVATPDGSSVLTANWEGGAFPNGLIDCTATMGDAGATGKMVILASPTITQFKVQILNGSGAGVGAVAQRVNYYAIGW